MTGPAEPVHPHVHPHDQRPNRLYQVAAWVAIVAGVIFIVGAVFFTGFTLGRNSGYGGWDHHGRAERMGPPMMPMRDQGAMMPPRAVPQSPASPSGPPPPRP